MATETTSARVGSLASRIMRMTNEELAAYAATEEGAKAIRSVAASATTQAPPK